MKNINIKTFKFRESEAIFISLYKGEKKIAGNVTNEKLRNDLGNYTVAFNDSAIIEGIESFYTISSQITTGTLVSSLVELIKAALLYLNTSLLNKLKSHQNSTDHDSRYYTETEIDTKISNINNNISVKVISGVDINTFISFDSLVPKLYYCEGCKNFPWSNGWLLCLPNSIGGNKSNKQIALRHGTYDVNNFNTQVRNYYNSSQVWSNWYSYMTNVDFANIDQTYHLIKFGKMGIYYGSLPIEQVPNGVASKELDMSSIFSGISSVTATLASGVPDKKNVSVIVDGTTLTFYMNNSLSGNGITHSWYTIVGTLI